MNYSYSSIALACLASLGLNGCGGGGGGGAPTAPATVSLSGSAVKGPVFGGQVCAYTLAIPRQQIACTTTDSDSHYKLALPAGAGDVLLEVTGGTYIDEATGSKVSLDDPLRTVAKVTGGTVENVLLTPFTELAVRQASLADTGGNITFIGFQTQVGSLEGALGFGGLASGKPFGGASADDAMHQKALTAFAKQQNSTGKTVGGALTAMGSTLDNCGPSALRTTLALYGAEDIAVTSASSGGGAVMLKTAQVDASLSITAGSLRVTFDPPTPCVDSVIADGKAMAFESLSAVLQSSALATAKNIEITACSPLASQTWLFPQADVVLRAVSLPRLVGIISLGESSVPILATSAVTGGAIIDLTAVNQGIVVSKNYAGDLAGSVQGLGTSSVALASGSSVIISAGSTSASGGLLPNGGALVLSGSGAGLCASGVSLSTGG